MAEKFNLFKETFSACFFVLELTKEAEKDEKDVRERMKTNFCNLS